MSKISKKEAAEMVKAALLNWEDGEDDRVRKGLEYMRDEISDSDLADSLNALAGEKGDKWDALAEIAHSYGRELS